MRDVNLESLFFVFSTGVAIAVITLCILVTSGGFSVSFL